MKLKLRLRKKDLRLKRRQDLPLRQLLKLNRSVWKLKKLRD